MLTLALETTAAPSGVALLSDDDIIEERLLDPGEPRGVGLFPAMQEILRAHGVSPGDVDVVAASLGPGSFTGIRIGLAAAKGFALFSRSRPVGVPTIDALVEEIPAGHGRIVVAIDATRGRVYAAILELSVDGPRAELEPSLLPAAELASRITPPAWVVGSAPARHPDAFTADGLTIAPPGSFPPRPSTIGRLARRRFAAAPDDVSFEPIYLQRPDAKTKAERAAAGGGGAPCAASDGARGGS